MPITQATVIELMRESRANIQIHKQMKEGLLAYLEEAKARYYNQPELHKILNGVVDFINYQPQVDDRATYKNEHHYRRAAKVNDKQRERQASVRRAKGVPTVEEALVILNARNALRRADLPTQPAVYKSDQELRAEYLLANPGALSDDPFANYSPEPERKATPSRPGIIFPRDDPDDPELEFETPEELTPIANLPTGAVDVIIDPLAGENNSQEEIDNPANLPDDSNGNPAKESGT